MSNVVFTARDKHAASYSAPPPDIQIPEGRPGYYGYFENGMGEQAVYVWDFEKTADPQLYLGDVGWDKPFTVAQDHTITGSGLGREEMDWLRVVNNVAWKRYADWCTTKKQKVKA